MKKILLSLLVVSTVSIAVFGATQAYFSDTEEVTGNTFSAGSLDLEVGSNEQTEVRFSAEGMLPGNSYNTGCVELSNTGTVDGKLTFMVTNLVSHDNGVLEPESQDGDTPSTEHDPDGYLGNTGNGELWDQITTKFCVESGLGSHATNGICDWDDTIIKGFSSTNDDYSSTYSIDQNTDLVNGAVEISAGDTVTFCSAVKFIDDTSNSWWGASSGLTNNMAMGDDATFDAIFGLVQAD